MRRSRCGVVFDVDGTLVDSNRAHAEAWAEALQHFGFDVPASRVQPLIGMGGDKLLPRLIGVEIDSPEGKEYGEFRSGLFLKKYLPRLRVFPGARELAERLDGDGIVMVVASSAGEEELGKLLDLVGIADLLTDTTSADDAERSKPDPDVVVAAAKRSGCSTGTLVMVGDTPYDVEAASRAGVSILAVRSGGWGDSDLAGAVAVYDDVGSILADYDGLFRSK